MTTIDRYITSLFARTILICFFSLGSVFVVFHAFNHLDDIAKQGKLDGSIAVTLANYYGPYLLMLFDWTGAIITLMALLFTIGWLRRSGELTALVAAGVSHGRILRPMIVLSLFIIMLQVANRELLIPVYRDILTTNPGELATESAQAMLPSYDKATGILIEGNGILAANQSIQAPSLRLYAAYPAYGDVVIAKQAVWRAADDAVPSGYLLSGVTSPEHIDDLPPGIPVLVDGGQGSPALVTRRDAPWLAAGECFLATTLNLEVLRDNPRSTRLTGMPELMRRVRNASIHSSDSLRVMMHERLIRPLLDICLVLLGLPLAVNRGDKRLFSVIAQAMGMVLLFFGLKTVAGGMGGSGYLISPSMAAWIPLLVLGPIAFARYRNVQHV